MSTQTSHDPSRAATSAADRLTRSGLAAVLGDDEHPVVELGPGVSDLADAAEAPAPAGSGLATLRQRIAAAKAEGEPRLDLLVPRMQGVGVRLRPLGSTELTVLRKKVAQMHKIKADERPLWENALALSAACLGVFITDEEGEPIGDPTEWVKPGPALARELGSDEATMPTAAHTIMGLFRTDGDLMMAAVELYTWSGSAQRRGEEAEGPSLGD